MNKWKIDEGHSEIGFKIKHLMISTVRGYFTNFDGSINLPDEDITKSSISLSIQTNSISTNNETRDGHLKSADFFDSEKFPTINFESTEIQREEGGNYLVTGKLTMHGVTKEMKFSAIYNGKIINAYKEEVMSFEISGSLSRESFGLNWNSALEAGGVTLSDEVILDINAEFKKVVN